MGSRDLEDSRESRESGRPRGPRPSGGRLSHLARSPLLALSLARLREFMREPGALFWTFGFPLLMTLALGVAFREQGPARARVGVADGPMAETSLAPLRKAHHLDAQILAASALEEALRKGEILVAVQPSTPGVGTPALPRIKLRFDPSRPEAAATAREVEDVLETAAGRKDVLHVEKDTAFVAGARYVDWLVPGLLGMQLLSGSLWGTAWNIVSARQRKLLKRLAATPMKRRHYLLSFRLTALIFVPVQLLVLFGFASVAFGVRVHGSALALLFLALLGSWSFAGLGLLCACRAPNTETANGLVNLMTLPMYMLSGVFFSAARFPSFLQPAIRALPLSAFNHALRAVVNDGAPLFAQGTDIALLVAWGVVTSVIALRLFRWT